MVRSPQRHSRTFWGRVVPLIKTASLPPNVLCPRVLFTGDNPMSASTAGGADSSHVVAISAATGSGSVQLLWADDCECCGGNGGEGGDVGDGTEADVHRVGALEENGSEASSEGPESYYFVRYVGWGGLDDRAWWCLDPGGVREEAPPDHVVFRWIAKLVRTVSAWQLWWRRRRGHCVIKGGVDKPAPAAKKRRRPTEESALLTGSTHAGTPHNHGAPGGGAGSSSTEGAGAWPH